METITHWINGDFTEGSGDRRGEVFDPARGVVSGEVTFASVEDVDAAVGAARKAFQEWRYVPVTRRQGVMFQYRQIVASRRRQMAEVLAAEHGKTVADAEGEVQRGLEVVEFAGSSHPSGDRRVRMRGGVGRLGQVIPPAWRRQRSR